jgi:hypothetical protein
MRSVRAVPAAGGCESCTEQREVSVEPKVMGQRESEIDGEGNGVMSWGKMSERDGRFRLGRSRGGREVRVGETYEALGSDGSPLTSPFSQALCAIPRDLQAISQSG